MFDIAKVQAAPSEDLLTPDNAVMLFVDHQPQMFSAWGMLGTEVRRDLTRQFFTPGADLDGVVWGSDGQSTYTRGPAAHDAPMRPLHGASMGAWAIPGAPYESWPDIWTVTDPGRPPDGRSSHREYLFDFSRRPR
ncbi:hypothetical protein ACS04_04710 [Streptomyces roseus]|uniref:Uncharacterized protein n=1 Tax=Streptomyces roseus TaxID=66430 RepID=A0A0J6XWB7_9ACTN|nr:hypothetical protein ACS04_04710 [Streptomyces roseus]